MMNLPPNHAKSVVEATEPKSLWRVIKAGMLYFVLVFTVSFVLGIPRVLWAVPHFGTRAAELMEAPFMFITIILTARWVVQRLAMPPQFWPRLGMGLFALGCLLIAEIEIVLQLRHLSIVEYIATRDPISGTVYYVMLCVFAVMPWLVSNFDAHSDYPSIKSHNFTGRSW